jgi:hypothetical protein
MEISQATVGAGISKRKVTNLAILLFLYLFILVINVVTFFCFLELFLGLCYLPFFNFSFLFLVRATYYESILFDYIINLFLLLFLFLIT